MLVFNAIKSKFGCAFPPEKFTLADILGEPIPGDGLTAIVQFRGGNGVIREDGVDPASATDGFDYVDGTLVVLTADLAKVRIRSNGATAVNISICKHSPVRMS